MRYDTARQCAAAEAYSHARQVSPPRRPRSSAGTLLIVASLLICAALCVALLLAHSRATAAASECEELAQRITELTDENARLTIEYESMFSLAEIEDYAKNVLGMVP